MVVRSALSTFLSRKKPKTLSGIETDFSGPAHGFYQAGKNLKPYQGLKHFAENQKTHQLRRKKPKTLSGIETPARGLLDLYYPSRKKPKTLSGIETNHG